MSETPNIHAHVFAICEQLGLVPKDVQRLDITSTAVVATVYKTLEGKKFCGLDGFPATDSVGFKVVT